MDVDDDAGRDEPMDMTILMIGDDGWYTTERLRGRACRRQALDRTSVDRDRALATMTMAEFADFLSQADEVESKGETKIDGKTAEHFQGKVNAREVAEETGGETAKRFKRACSATGT